MILKASAIAILVHAAVARAVSHVNIVWPPDGLMTAASEEWMTVEVHVTGVTHPLPSGALCLHRAPRGQQQQQQQQQSPLCRLPFTDTTSRRLPYRPVDAAVPVPPPDAPFAAVAWNVSLAQLRRGTTAPLTLWASWNGSVTSPSVTVLATPGPLPPPPPTTTTTTTTTRRCPSAVHPRGNWTAFDALSANGTTSATTVYRFIDAGSTGLFKFMSVGPSQVAASGERLILGGWPDFLTPLAGLWVYMVGDSTVAQLYNLWRSFLEHNVPPAPPSHWFPADPVADGCLPQRRAPYTGCSRCRKNERTCHTCANVSPLPLCLSFSWKHFTLEDHDLALADVLNVSDATRASMARPLPSLGQLLSTSGVFAPDVLVVGAGLHDCVHAPLAHNAAVHRHRLRSFLRLVRAVYPAPKPIVLLDAVAATAVSDKCVRASHAPDTTTCLGQFNAALDDVASTFSDVYVFKRATLFASYPGLPSDPVHFATESEVVEVQLLYLKQLLLCLTADVPAVDRALHVNPL